MYPTISAALAEDRHETLLRQAARSRRAAEVRAAEVAEVNVEVAHPTGSRRRIGRPFAAFHCWLARGYL